jgi:hypothetical protein
MEGGRVALYTATATEPGTENHLKNTENGLKNTENHLKNTEICPQNAGIPINRGYAFAEYESHAAARAALGEIGAKGGVQGCVLGWKMAENGWKWMKNGWKWL